MTQPTKSVAAKSASAGIQLGVGFVVVVIFGVGLSIAAAKGVFRSPPREVVASRPEADQQPAPPPSALLTYGEPGAGMQALQLAAAENKYLFAFFWSESNSQTAAMRGVFDAATAQVADRAAAVAVRVSDPAERDIVRKFELDRAPMPLVLAIAPNGAVMGGFPTQFTVDELVAAFGSPGSEHCVKALQDGKLVLLCVQNASTKLNDEALQGVHAFKTDEKFASATEVIMVNPADSAEKSFLNDLKINAQTTAATTALIAPPGSVIAQYAGATTKEEFITALQQANTGCGPGGCGPGGCGPR
jgi:hypothetical protein